MKASDHNKTYKETRRVEREKEKMVKHIEKHKVSLEAKRQKKLKEMESSINVRFEKTLAKVKKRAELTYEKKKREIQGKRKLKKHTKKPPTTAKLKKDLYCLVQKYSRLRDSDVLWYWKCISCDRSVHYKKADWWHYISRQKMMTAFDPDNINLQCKRDNQAMAWLYWLDEAKKVEAQYRENLIKKVWKKKVEWMEANRNRRRDRKRSEIIDLIAKYKRLNRDLEARKQKPLL